MNDLRQRLQELARREAMRQPPEPARSGMPLEEAIDGKWVETPTGRCYVTERRFGGSYVHGGRRVDGFLALPSEVWEPFVAGPPDRVLDPSRALFLDAETTGLGGGGGTYAFLVGVGSFEDDAFVVRQFFMGDYEDEPALLDLLEGALAASRGLVSFNGRAFDWPLLASRFVMARREPVGDDLPHLDLLLLCRRLWREMLPSCSLSSLEEHVLGLERSFVDIAGHLIPDIYRRYVEDRDAAPLDGVFYHNLVDVLSLSSLAQVAAEIASEGLDKGDDPLCDAYALGRLYEGTGRIEAAARAYGQAWRGDSRATNAWEAGWRESMLFKRRGAFDAAVERWQGLLDGPRPDPYLELAKHYEHRLGDLHEARRWTLEALAWLDQRGDRLERWKRERLSQELGHRLGRLDGKLARNARDQAADR
ncbi:MAG: ribonuclease H-like domain-containing protein [Anaerolineae bacterium]